MGLDVAQHQLGQVLDELVGNHKDQDVRVLARLDHIGNGDLGGRDGIVGGLLLLNYREVRVGDGRVIRIEKLWTWKCVPLQMISS